MKNMLTQNVYDLKNKNSVWGSTWNIIWTQDYSSASAQNFVLKSNINSALTVDTNLEWTLTKIFYFVNFWMEFFAV